MAPRSERSRSQVGIQEIGAIQGERRSAHPGSLASEGLRAVDVADGDSQSDTTYVWQGLGGTRVRVNGTSLRKYEARYRYRGSSST